MTVHEGWPFPHHEFAEVEEQAAEDETERLTGEVHEVCLRCVAGLDCECICDELEDDDRPCPQCDCGDCVCGLE